MPKATTADAERTLSAPDALAQIESAAVPGFTVLWHPDKKRVGEQTAIVADAGSMWQLNRHAPLFRRGAGDNGYALEHRCISRTPLRILATGYGGLVIEPQRGKMSVRVDGVELHAPTTIDATRIDRGVIVTLGGRVMLCLHWQAVVAEAGDSMGLVGVSRAMTRVRRQIRLVAPSNLAVLILGESGVGKELVAQAIHANSARARRELVVLNMATLGESLAAAELFGAVKGAYTGAQTTRKGFFAEADGSSLFLDEIGDTPAPVQPMLLRAVESGEYRPVGATRIERADVRVIAATDRQLDATGFNLPLLRRLQAYTIAMPALRERREDIGLLIKHFLSAEAEPGETFPDLPATTIERLAMSDWPGNVRQLGNTVRQVMLHFRQTGTVPLDLVDVPAPKPDITMTSVVEPTRTAGGNAYRQPSTVDDDELYAALEASQWSVLEAAQRLRVSRASFYALLEASDRVRRIDDIPLDEIRAVVARAPDDPAQWASQLRTPREALRRRVRRLKLASN